MEQPRINLGLVGHIDHGKTTLLQAISGEWADRHSEELKRGISIKLGYANATIRKCPDCDEPECYVSKETCPECGTETEVVKRLSFIDAPGHEVLMATMLSGAATMDAALFVIAANEECPQPQTREHLKGLEVLGIENIIIAQNKIDLVSQEEGKQNHKQIKEFVKGTVAEDAPIIPVSAQKGINIDVLLRALDKEIEVPERDLDKSPVMLTVRSFDVNKPGRKAEDLVGGVLGGVLKQGKLEKGEKIVIKPGLKTDGWEPIKTEVTSIMAGDRAVEEALPGGSLGIGTNLDPFLTKSDKLAGSVVGKEGEMPETRNELSLDVELFDKVVGTQKDLEVGNLKSREQLMINAWTARVTGTVSNPQEVKIKLGVPVCIEKGSKVAISRKIRNRWRLIGYGVVK